MIADVGGQNRKFEYPYLHWKLQAVNGVDRSLKRLGLLRRNDRYKTPCPVASSISLQKLWLRQTASRARTFFALGDQALIALSA